MLPYVEVSNLPPSASFYSAITHPLGLKYISANSGAIVYGAASPTDPNANDPVFEVRSLGDLAEPRKHARLVFSASSPSVVQDFRAAALRALPDPLLIGGAEDLSHRHSDADPAAGGNHRAQIRDLDGNIMEVVYVPPVNHPTSYAASTVRRTQSTTHEVSRIMNWNLDLATSQPSKSVIAGSAGGARTTISRRTGSGAGDEEPPYVLRRSVTTSVIETRPVEPAPPSREDSTGLSTSAVFGSILGAVAAGAAIGGAMTYMNMRNQREQAPRQEFQPPAFQRRATEPFPDPRPRYMERTVEKVYYEDQLPPVNGRYYPPPTYMAKYSQAGSRSREVEELDDRSRSSRYTPHQSSSGRSRARSAAGTARQPLMIADAEYRSNAGSKYTTAPKMLVDTEQHSHADARLEADLFNRAPSKHSTPRSMRHHEPDAATYISSRSKHEVSPDSYVSARSSRHRPPEAETYISSRNKSHAADAATYVSSRSKPHAPETYVSSRSKRSERSDRTASTIRPSGKPVPYDAPRSVVYGDLPIRSAAQSRAPSKPPSAAPSRHSAARTAATARLIPVARHYPLPESHISYASAREVPLPSSRAGWNDDDDEDDDSIAPSDSISCIGTGSRSRYH